MNHILAMLFGIIGSIQIHVSKCFQLHGIETLEHIKADWKSIKNGSKPQKKHELEEKQKRFKRHIYLTGFLLSNSAFIWIMLANKYAPASYFTSMFGFGMIILLIYAEKILKEKVTHYAYWGAFIIIIGTVLIGLNSPTGNAYSFTRESMKITVFVIAIIMIIIGVLLAWARKKSPRVVAMAFGFSGGAMSCFDPLFKSIGQSYESVPGLLPSNCTGWIFFITSLFFTTSAFVISQWAFTKNVKATLFIPIFNSVYIVLPMLLMKAVLTELHFSVWSITGMIMIILGMFIMREVSRYEA